MICFCDYKFLFLTGIMNAVSIMRNVVLQWLFTSGRPVHKFPTVSRCTTWSITCESKVQGIVSLGRHWVLFALGRHWVLTNGTWHVLLQSENVFELRGITIDIDLNDLRSRRMTWITPWLRSKLCPASPFLSSPDLTFTSSDIIWRHLFSRDVASITEPNLTSTLTWRRLTSPNVAWRHLT